MHNILIIDDDDQIRKMYEIFLESEGFEVKSAASGEEGLRTFWKNEFDLVITDLFMPGIDGLYVTSKIREVNKAVPILGISGGPDQNNPNRSLSSAEQLGAFKILKKPVELDILLGEIKHEIEYAKSKLEASAVKDSSEDSSDSSSDSEDSKEECCNKKSCDTQDSKESE